MSIHTATDDFAAAVQASKADDLAYAIPTAAHNLGKAMRAFMDAVSVDEVGTIEDAISDFLHDHISDEVAHHDTMRHGDIHSAAMRSLERGMERVAA